MQRLTSKGRARHSEVPKSLHASLDISTHTFNVYILKTGTEHSGRKTIRYDGETRSYQKNILNKNLLFSRQKSRAYLKFDLHLHGFWYLMPKVIAVMKVVENDTEARVFEAKQKVEVKKLTYIRFYYISKLTVFAVQTPTGKHIRWISGAIPKSPTVGIGGFRVPGEVRKARTQSQYSNWEANVHHAR